METNFSWGSSRINSGSCPFPNAKRFAYDTSLFTIVNDKNKSANVLNNDLKRICNLAYNWKMFFNPDPTKAAQEVLFSRKKKLQSHPNIRLNNILFERASYVNYLGMLLDEKLNFKQHIDSAVLKIKKGISVKKKLLAFRPLVNFGDIIYE